MSNSINSRKYLTEDELKRLLHVIKGRKSARDEAIFLVTYWRGLRASEVGRIPLSAWRPPRDDANSASRIESPATPG